ncbi:MAG: cytidine deaminase [Bacteroidota bacterium]
MKEFATFSHIEDLDSESKYLIHKAKEATVHSYSPYSKFCVGSAIILEDGTVITGANQENASYPLCMCAERVTLYAVSAQFPGKRIMKMAVVAHKKNHKELTPASPCGACRQVLLESEQRQHRPIEVIMLGPEEKWIKCSSAHSLLPFGFDGKVLE